MDDENEITEMWREVHDIRSEKRHQNLESSTDILKRLGVQFTSHNNGVHLVVFSNSGDKTFDFWPSTGNFVDRETNTNGRGVMNLLKLIQD